MQHDFILDAIGCNLDHDLNLELFRRRDDIEEWMMRLNNTNTSSNNNPNRNSGTHELFRSVQRGDLGNEMIAESLECGRD